MAVLSQPQVRTFAVLGGLPNPDLMAAIAMAESGGNTDAIGAVGEVGLWQINQPVHVKAHPTWTVAWLRNPSNNAAAARVVLNAQGLSAWTTYTNGAYRRFYGSAEVAAGAAQSVTGGFPNPISDLLDTAGQVGRLAQAVAKGANWISNPSNWVRIVYVGVGGALIVTAMMLTQSSASLRLGKQAIGVGAKLLGGKGKAASAAGEAKAASAAGEATAASAAGEATA